MSMRIIEEAEVRRILTPQLCVSLMKDALMGLEEGRYEMPPRLITHMPNTAAFGFMPAWIGSCYGAKVLSAYAPNATAGYPSHIGYVMIFESEHSTVTGLVDATAITEIRTGAVSAAATDVLARKDAHVLGLIGAGAQARSHTAAILTVRPIDRIHVYDLRREAAEAFAREIVERFGIEVLVASSVREAVQDCDIVCTLTPSKAPFLTDDMIRPGTHINAVGTFSPTTREIASDLMAVSALYADQVSAMKRESGEYLIPLSEGLLNENAIRGSVGDVLLGRAPGRQCEEEITLFDALGLAVEDVLSAAAVLDRAEAV